MKQASVVGFDDVKISDNYEVPATSKKKSKKKGGGFAFFDLSDPVMRGLKKRGYKLPTPIQRKSVPIILEGRDVVAMARTGSGKTACFLLPLFEKLVKSKSLKTKGIRALILSPTRELALQTLRFIRELGSFTQLKATAVLGGDSMDQQFGALHEDPDIVVATPGRFLHLCVEMDLKLSSVEYIVFDEADRLFEMGFGEQLQEILNRLPESRQTVLFSATLPKLLVNFARAGLSDPALIRLDVESKLPDTLELAFLAVRTEDKPAALLSLLQTLPVGSQTLVFFATKHHVEYCHMILDLVGISNTFIYSDLDPSARKINAAKFQNGKASVLLVTDVAARGVDIPKLDYVVNYHFPAKAKLFVHRVGRCARAGRTGTAFSLVSAEECPFVLDLHLFLGQSPNFLPAMGNSTNKENAFGKIPEAVTETEHSRILGWLDTTAELASMQKVCSNGYKKYLRSRPGASPESVKRMREIDFSKLGIHPFFESSDEEAQLTRELLDQMKTYKPRGTIFELNVSAKSKSYEVMKITKKAHQKHIQNFKQNKIREASEKGSAVPNNEREMLPMSDDKEIQNTFSTVIMGKRKAMNLLEGSSKKKRKLRELVDKEHYVPHFAPDKHSEEGFSMDTFSTEANKIGFDLTGDSEEGLTVARKMMKWDKKKKKMVGVQSEKAGKIRTESGVWISKTYKSNRYAEWKEKSKVTDDKESGEEDEEEVNQKRRSNFPNTHWGRHNLKMAAKHRSKSELKKPEEIMKKRKELHKRRQRSQPKNKKFGKSKKKK